MNKSLESILGKVATIFSGLLLSLNLGCSAPRTSYSEIPSPIEDRTEHAYATKESITQNSTAKDPGTLKVNAGKCLANILGGVVVSIAWHESGHALVARAFGTKVTDIKISDKDEEGNWHPCTIFYDENYPEYGSKRDTMIALAGPLTERLMAEVINYNLRNGNVPEKCQPFLATASLVSRYFFINETLCAERGMPESDLSIVSKNTGINPEIMMSAALFDAVLNARRIAKEVRVALGKETYPHNTRANSRLELVPSPDSIGLVYTREF